MANGKPITDILREIRGGVLVNEASTQLAELVERVQESGKKGTITISLTLAPGGKGNRIITVTPKLSVKAPPKPDTEDAAIFYAERGQLLRDDPNQAKLDLDRRREEKMRADGSSPAEQTGTTG